MTRPVGRPPSDNPRNQVVRFRITTEEWNRLHATAKQAGYDSTAAWVRDVALRVARRET